MRNVKQILYVCYLPLTFNTPIATKVVCFSRLLKCLRSLYGKQCGPRSDCSYRSSLGAVCSGSTLLTSILNSSVMFGNYLQQTTTVDDIFRRIFFAGTRSAVGNVSGYRCVSDWRSRGREFDPGPVPYFRGD